MFYYIIPDKTPQIPLQNFFQNIFPKDSQLKLVQNRNLRAFNILWTVEKNRDENVGFVDFYYKIEGNKILLDAICLEFEYKIPLYVPLEEVIAEVLKYFKRVIGAFTIYDLYMQKSFHITTRKNRLKTSTIISDVRSEAYTQENQFLSQTANESDVDKVLDKIESFPEQFRIYSYSAYIAQLKRANLNTQERVEKILVKAISVLEKIENPDLRLFLTFKLILYYKSFSSSYIDLISHNFLIKQLLPVLMRLSLQKEIAQLLIADTTLYLFNSSDPQLAKEAVTEILDTLAEHKNEFLLFPELKTIYTFNTTGNYKAAFGEYIKRTKPRGLTELRGQYETIVTDANLITEFRSQVLMNNYYKKLSFADRMAHLPMYLKITQKDYRIHIITSVASLFITIGLTILPYLYYWSISNEQGTTLSTQLFTWGYITSALVVNALVGSIYWFLMWMIVAMVRGIKSPKYNPIVKVILGLVSTGTFLFMFLFSLMFSIILNSSLVSPNTLWGIQNNSIIMGYDKVSFTDMEGFSVIGTTCQEKDNCEGTLITLKVNPKEGPDQYIKLYNVASENRNTTCALINKSLALANINEVPLNLSAEDNKSLSSICGE